MRAGATLAIGAVAAALLIGVWGRAARGDATPVPTASSTAMPTPTATSTAMPTPTATSTATPTPTTTATATPTPTTTATATPTPTTTATAMPTPTTTAMPTPTTTATAMPTPTTTATATPTPTPVDAFDGPPPSSALEPFPVSLPDPPSWGRRRIWEPRETPVARALSSREVRAHRQHVGGAWLMGIGATGLLLGTVFGFVAVGENEQSKKGCDEESACTPEAAKNRNMARRFGVGSTAALIGGAVVGALGLVVYVTAPSPRAPKAHATALRLGPAFTGIEGTFR